MKVNPYQSPVASTAVEGPLRSSGFGIASFIVSLIAGLGELATLTAVAIAEATTPGGVHDDSTLELVIGLSIFVFIGLTVLGFVLGLVSLLQGDRSRTLGVIGIALSSVQLVAIAGMTWLVISLAG